MPPKRKRTDSTPGSAKKQRKAIDLNTKLKIIKDYEGGKKVLAIASSMGLAHSTISTIIKDKERVKETARTSVGYDAVITRQRKGLIHEMEKLLAIWLDHNLDKKIAMNLYTIQAKALSLFKKLKEREGPECEETFTASRGWFHRFRNRFNLKNTKVVGEAASADVDGAEKFVDELDEIIEKEGYLPEQIFNVDECALFWKKMPTRSYVHTHMKTMSGFKAFKDRFTLLFGGNVAGYKLKPLLLYHSQNPRALKNVNKHMLPVHYRANSKGWMSQAMFEDWFSNCFIPEVRNYCAEKGIPFKILLLLDNAPAHPKHIDDLHPDVKVVYLPKNTTSVLQPMDQGVIANFKALYLRTTFGKAVEATEDDKMTLIEFWKSYNILDCIKNIKLAWNDVGKKCMQGVWKKCLKRFVNSFEGFDQNAESEVINNKIVNLARAMNLEIDSTDAQELVDYVEEELGDEDLMELEKQRHQEKAEEEDETRDVVEKKFTVKGLASVFSKINEALLELEAMDPNVERHLNTERYINQGLRCYHEIYEEKKKHKKQASVLQFFRPVSSTPPTRTPSPSGPSTYQELENTPSPGPSTSHESSVEPQLFEDDPDGDLELFDSDKDDVSFDGFHE